MHRISCRIIRFFLYPISSRIPDLTCRISGRIPDTENSRISGLISSQIEEITISFNTISLNVFLKPLLLWFKKMLTLYKCYLCFKYVKRKPSIHMMSLFISYFTRHLKGELKIRSDIRYRYPACT
jgi:hypothetical protein